MTSMPGEEQPMDMEILCMQMIVEAGSAKSDYMEALQAAKKGDYAAAEAKMKSGDEHYAIGHERHAHMIQQEASGESVTMNLLLTHVEDQMMGTETIKTMVMELIDAYKQLNDQR
jgi:PTS system cellobiose-specific IIA component